MIDPNTAVSAAGEGAKAVSKLGEIVQKMFSPRWTRKQADADAYADDLKLIDVIAERTSDVIFKSENELALTDVRVLSLYAPLIVPFTICSYID